MKQDKMSWDKNSKGLWIIVASIWNMIPNKELYDLDLIGFGWNVKMKLKMG